MDYMKLYEISKKIKKEYTPGTRVKLVKMEDAYTKIPIGTLGTVQNVDDIATIHVNWDNGSTLGVAYGEDEISIETSPIHEYCPYCEDEVELQNRFEIQTCSCGEKIKPCCLCESCSTNCPLD